MSDRPKKCSVNFDYCCNKKTLHLFYIICRDCKCKCVETSMFVEAYRQYELDEFHRKSEQEYYD